MPGTGGRFGCERAAAGRDHHDLGQERRAGVGRQPEAAVAQALQRLDPLAEMEGRRRTA